jgi:hypothetical protein
MLVQRRACKSQRIENDAQSGLLRKIAALKNQPHDDKSWIQEIGKIRYLAGVDCLGVTDVKDNAENVPQLDEI